VSLTKVDIHRANEWSWDQAFQWIDMICEALVKLGDAMLEDRAPAYGLG
jgi:hypothetical protein